MGYSDLKQLIDANQATIIFIGGTTRSGSTIAQVIFSSLVDRSIHQPFMGLLHQQSASLKSEVFDLKSHVFEQGCDLLIDHILEILKHQEHATILVKEVIGFFDKKTWVKWIELPQKFMFTIRDPHLQFFSWLSLITDLCFADNGSFLKSQEFVIKECATIENIEIEQLQSGWEGTTLTYNQTQWENLDRYIKKVRELIAGTSKKMSIVELSLLQANPSYVISKNLNLLGWNHQKENIFSADSISQAQQKVFDIRDINRPAVKKARSSDRLESLKLRQTISTNVLTPSSQEHIFQLIPLYLDILYSGEQVGMLSLEQLEEPVAGSEKLKLEDINSFLAYAVAKFNLHQKMNSRDKANLAQRISQRIITQETEILDKKTLQYSKLYLTKSFEQIDHYWNFVS